jgi:3-dehydroquinate dehydratase-2
LHGPNLNLLGSREPEIYGRTTLADIDRALHEKAARYGVELRIVQSNSEAVLIETIQSARDWAMGIIINAGAYAHYSYAIADAIAATGLPAVEIHISNIHAREPWRHHSVLGAVTVGSVIGLGWRGYVLALDGLFALLSEDAPRKGS